MEEVTLTIPREKNYKNNLKEEIIENEKDECNEQNQTINKMEEITSAPLENEKDEFTYSFEQDPNLKSLMTNFDNSILVDSFQNECLQFDTEKILNVNPAFFYNDDIFNSKNYEISSKELFEKLVKDRTAFMNVLLIDLSIYSNFSICGAQMFPNLKQACIKLKDVTDYIDIKKELYNACYLVFEDQWDRKDDSTIIIFDDDGKSQCARAFTEICIEAKWGCEAFMLKDGILSFMKDYPMLCVSEEFNEDDEYDDDDDDDDYYYNEGLYRTIDNNNTFNEPYTNSIEMVDIRDTKDYESNDNNIIFKKENSINDTAETSNLTLNDVVMTNDSQYQNNDIIINNNNETESINSNSVSKENKTTMNTNNKTEISSNIGYEQIDKKRKINDSGYDDNSNSIIANEVDMDYQTIEEETLKNNNISTENNSDEVGNNENIMNSEFIDEEITDLSESATKVEGDKVTDSMACYDPRQMASVNVDHNNNSKLLKNNQTEEIMKLRKFQRYLIHNVWYAMDNSNDVPLMVCPPFLYLGSLYTSQEHHLIKYNIKHIIRLGTDFNISYTDPSKFNFYNFDIFDLPREPIKELFKRANDIIEKARLNNENVLVHCHAGVSRSSTIILAYLMRYKGMSLYDAWCSTFKIRPIIRPNDGFAIALQEYEKMLFGYSKPSIPVVGMSNSYLFSIEYFDFVSRLEEMHKLDPSVPVFRPEKTYNDLLKKVEEEKEKNNAKNIDENIDNKSQIEIENITKDKSLENDENNISMDEDESKNSEILEDKVSSDINEDAKNSFKKDNFKNVYISNDKDYILELDESNELKTREE
ncbi:hypothetical protein BCR36DRAFT_580767 [Piromyces finnis]|uniref:protein-tyrosine-phosphatase n=1 Tax=Piromyces finnis TaxID=1754191 RepID=A0A1Y1VHG6_9FUNG|nr:hypothetical protein BCR36DRAFT_580767 [Piromyces finnis]|eukprot:ORX56463.1 hypothetical protein BCR36DRAFT_580767 [Piromyces finnis]